MTAEDQAMAGGPHKLAVEFMGGPVDGQRGFLPMGLDTVPVTVGPRAHRYEFDPVTTAEGFWVYRHAGESPTLPATTPTEGGAA